MFDEDAIIRYQNGVADLQRRKKEQVKVAEVRKKLHLKSIETIFEAEELAARQDYESEKALLFERLKEDLEKKIDLTENEFFDHKERNKLLQLRPVVGRKCKSKYKNPFYKPFRKRQTDVRGGPFIVYMLKDEEIQDDLKIIRKALRKRELSPVCCKETLNGLSNQQIPEKAEIEHSYSSETMDRSISKGYILKTKKLEKLLNPSDKKLAVDESNYIGSVVTSNKADYASSSTENFDFKCSPIDLSKKKVFESKVTHIPLVKECVPNPEIEIPSNVSFQANSSNCIVAQDKNYGIPSIIKGKQSSQFRYPQVDYSRTHSPFMPSYNKLNVQSKPINESSVIKENFSISEFDVPSGVTFPANNSSFIDSSGINNSTEQKNGSELYCSHVNSVSIHSPINLSCNDTNTSYGTHSTILASLSGVNCPKATQYELSDVSSGFLKYSTSMNSVIERKLENFQQKKIPPSQTSSVSSIVPSCTDSYSRNSEYYSIRPICVECSCNNITASEVICSSDSKTIPEEHNGLETLGETFVSFISETSKELVYYTENPISTVNGVCSTLSFTKAMHFINNQTDAELMFISDCEQITVETSKSPQNSSSSEVFHKFV